MKKAFCEKRRRLFCYNPEEYSNNKRKDKRSIVLKKYLLEIDPAAAKFYETIARRTGTATEKLMAETLFRFAGELSVKAVLENRKTEN